MQTKIEIDAKLDELQSQINETNKALASRKQQIIAVVSIVFIVAIIGYYFSYANEYFYFAMTFSIICGGAVFGIVSVAGIAGIVAGTAVVAGIAGTVAGITGIVVATYGIAAAAGNADITITCIAVALGVGVVITSAAEKLLAPLEESINALNKEIDALAYLSPEEAPQTCNTYAEWIDMGEPIAVDFHAKLEGRKPTYEEFNDLAKQITVKNAPPSEEELAKAACERLFAS